jgi:predicted porin
MKKTLVALAALAATASFAQSSVGITGVLDLGFQSSSTPTTAANTTTSTAAIAQNGVSTSAIKFVGTEDIGGGMKASFLAEINPNLVQSSTSNQNYAFATDFNGTPFNGEQFLGLSGGFGDVKLGVPNAAFFYAINASQPFGTAIGSAYGAGRVARLGTRALGIVSGVGSGTARIIRHERSVQYTTPTMSGFTASVTYAAQNDNTVNTTPGNQDGYTDLSLTYSNGPLNVAYAMAVNTFGNNALVPSLTSIPYVGAGSGIATPVAAGLAGGNYTYNALAGNYTFGTTTVYAGYTTTKSNNISTASLMEDATSYNIAAKYVMGQIDLLGNYTVRTSNIAGVNNASVLGLGANYNLSKRTSVYYRYEQANANTNNQADTAGGSVTNVSMVGLRHAF